MNKDRIMVKTCTKCNKEKQESDFYSYFTRQGRRSLSSLSAKNVIINEGKNTE